MRTRIASVIVLGLVLAGTARGGEPTERLLLKSGDRIVLVGSGWLEQERTHGHLEALLLACHPSADLTIRNLAWGGDTVRGSARTGGYQHPDGLPRLLKEVQDQKPTVIFIGYGMNESFDGPAGLAAFRNGYEQLLARLAPLKARIVLLSPTYHEDLGRPLPDPAEHNRQLADYVATIKQLAVKHGLRFVNLFEALRAAKKREPAIRLTTNGLLLSTAGHVVVARAIGKRLGTARSMWRLVVAHDGEVLFSFGTRVTKAEGAAGRLRLATVAERLPLSEMGDVQVLRVRELPAGKYALTIDGETITRATAREWQEGVKLTTGPDYRDADKLRAAIVRKNALFYRRWRPFNDHSRHWGFMKGDYALYDKEIAETERVIAQVRRPRAHVFILSATGDAK